MANDITTVEMVKDATRVPQSNTKWDALFESWIKVAGDGFEKRYKRPLTATDFVETYYDVDSGQLLNLRHAPVNSLASIVTYDQVDSASGTTLTLSTDFRLENSESGIVKFTKLSAFIPVGLQEAMALIQINWGKVIISYNSGLTTVPETIQRTAAELIAHWFDQYGVNQELKSDGIGDVTNDYFDFTKWPETVREMFALYNTAADNLVGII